MVRRTPYSGPALFSYGFRPFFLAASLFALGVVPVWLCVWLGALALAGPFAPVDWHVHEMLFGYAAAVVAGFLFTAIPNWTGRMPTRGWPLASLAALWIAGRLAVAGLLPLSAAWTMAVDCGFLLAIVAMTGIEIVAGRNWRNMMVMAPVTLLLAAIGVDGMHDQARLHAHRGAIAAVDPLHLPRDESIGDVVHAGAAIALDGRAEQAELAHLRHDRAVEALVPIGLEYARHQLFLAVGAGGVAQHALVLRELVVEEKRILPIEARRLCVPGA